MSVIRVRQIPAGHSYVEHLLPPEAGEAGAAGAAGMAGGGGATGGAGEVGAQGGRTAYPQVVHLPDPPVPGAPPGQWWPHPALEADWPAAHADEQDVVHLHFGFEGRTAAQLAAWIGRLRHARTPLVHTVHDLDHPHLVDQRRHHAHLLLLVEHADALLTLTEGAADEVRRRYGRRPLVVPHPHVVPLDRIGRPRPARPARRGGTLRIGLHLKNLRTNLAPMRVLPPLVEAVRQLRAVGPAATLEIRAHPELLDAEGTAETDVVRALRTYQAAPPEGVEVVVAPRLDDDELWDYLSGLDVSVLPYAWATHSGWVEACRDLGTHVLAPDVGFLAEQGGVLTWGAPDAAPPVERLVELLTVAAAQPARSVSAQVRLRERETLARAHAEVYSAVLRGGRIEGEVS